MSTKTTIDPAPASAPVSAPLSGDGRGIAAFNGVRRIPAPINDPNRTYAAGSPERAEIKAPLKSMATEKIDIPIVIGGREIRTGNTAQAVMPHDHAHVLADRSEEHTSE